ncbi:alpha-ketoacid dehydrogenase subunit beta [Pseudofrankia asymbiotica]|uniref:Alpha-ketoacid dehydrogenase subunit beta n=1 Tax=Pseudofrankia asymbiotica TaxID=1834516 RepID=A0A1V2I7H1_9ACTN|nr:transketolase C-terminal domain-containing protein [Pseudofrankia asymbiotica]ONH27994.1 alpha-ketoacid dehydrogenase subunit beta [Pseudofrankia asymbiotica]
MAKTTYLMAIGEAMREEMERDPSVFILGEDVANNLYGSTSNFVEDFGKERVRNTPISEGAIAGAATGAAMAGMRPIADFNIAPFMYVAMDQIVSMTAKSTYIYGGQTKVPVVMRAVMLYGNGNAAQHSDRPYPTFMTVPGLKIIAPSSAYDVKGMLKSAIRDDDPVLCFEDGNCWFTAEDLPDEEYLVPLGVADVKREGTDVTVVGIAGAVPQALAAAELLAEEGVSVEVVDPRTLAPMDTDTILASVEKTGRLVVADPAHEVCSAASQIAAVVAEHGFWHLQAPIVRVTTPQIHIPFAPPLEAPLFPSSERIAAAVRSVLE